MSGLVLKLAPRERVLINGAVIQNGDRRARISITTPDVHVLRLRDAIHPDRACTPVTRAVYIAQLILTGDADPVEGRRQLMLAIEHLSQVFDDRDSRLLLAEATAAAAGPNPYLAMRRLRDLLPREARLFAATRQ